MAHRPEDQPQRHEVPSVREISVRLSDLEPVLGLSAAVARFCGALTPDAYAALSTDAMEALSAVQGIMWRLEHSNPEASNKPTKGT